MKLLILTSLAIFTLNSCAYNRIGDLNMLSNRNIDKSTNYVLIERNVEGVGKMKKDDALERAVDEATESVNGEYLMNVKVYVKDNGNKIKVVGDVWGVKQNNSSFKNTIDVGEKVKVILKNKAVVEATVLEVDSFKGTVRVSYNKGNKDQINWFTNNNVVKLP